MRTTIRKILIENKEIDNLLKIMINSKINPLFYLSIQEKLIDDYGYGWGDDVDNIIEAHKKYFKLVYNMDFTPYNFLTAFFSHLTENKKYFESSGKVYYEKNSHNYFMKDVESEMFYFDFENVWNRLHEFFSLSFEEIKKITKQWVNKELDLKRYHTYLYR
jgi:hypothetical protein